MSSDSLRKAWREQAADGETVDSGGALHELLQSVRHWLSGQAHIDKLRASMHAVRALLNGAAHELRGDLQRSTDVAAPLTASFEQSLQAYEMMQSAVDVLEQASVSGDRVQAQQALHALEAAERQAQESRDSRREWMNQPVPLCPRHALPHPSGGLMCPLRGCGLELLIGDADLNLGRGYESAELGGPWKAVHNSYLQVLRGQAPLSALLATLGPLAALLEQIAGRSQDREAVALARTSLAAVAELRAVRETRRIADLHAGWARLFEEGVRLQPFLTTGSL